jgi:hypothetical protein
MRKETVGNGRKQREGWRGREMRGSGGGARAKSKGGAAPGSTHIHSHTKLKDMEIRGKKNQKSTHTKYG